MVTSDTDYDTPRYIIEKKSVSQVLEVTEIPVISHSQWLMDKESKKVRND